MFGQGAGKAVSLLLFCRGHGTVADFEPAQAFRAAAWKRFLLSFARADLPSPEVEHMAEPVEVSVVIPCLNEANSIGVCVEKAREALRSAGLRGEVVVADNGSTDGSVDIAAGLG